MVRRSLTTAALTLALAAAGVTPALAADSGSATTPEGPAATGTSSVYCVRVKARSRSRSARRKARYVLRCRRP